jgi:hypothetical protein
VVRKACTIVICFVLFLFYFKGEAQLLDTFRVLLKNKSSLDLRLESRYSFINNDLAVISGIRIGASFKRKLRLGGGISWLKSDILHSNYTISETNVVTYTPNYLKLAYLAFYADFVFYKTKRWQVSIPIQTGVGYSWYQSDYTYAFSSGKKYLFFLYEPGVSTHFKIFKWCGLGLDVGYRFALKNNHYIDERFSSPTYAFKVLFWADQLYYELFPDSKLARKKGPAAW